MSEYLGFSKGCDWEQLFYETLSKKITDCVNNIVLDEESIWKNRLINEILLTIKQSVPTLFNEKSPSTFLSDTEMISCSNVRGNDKTLTRNAVSGDRAAKDISVLSDSEILQLLNEGILKQRELESLLPSDLCRAVRLRRMYLTSHSSLLLSDLPYENYCYNLVNGACCENVIGYVPIPTGFVGPLVINGKPQMIPFATTEGALVASTSRGCKAVTEAKGVWSRVFKDGMTRAPVLCFKTAMEALEVKEWLEDGKHFETVKNTFDATSNYGKLTRIEADLYGPYLYVRFEATTGDAMGMNMVSKGVEAVLRMLSKQFSNMQVLSISGNYCVDKKACALNWTKGRGKCVFSEAVIPDSVVNKTLKTTVKSLCNLAKAKFSIGSSMAGTIGGWNAHAANIVAAIFLATGQDVAQVVSSSMCLTTMDETSAGDLHITCTMRCLEVGTVGGGTVLPAQKASLKMLDCDGPNKECPGANSQHLAKIICSTVLAGELSLMAAQCTHDLVKSHLKLNRSAQTLFLPDKCSPVPITGESLRIKEESLSATAFSSPMVRRCVPEKNSVDAKLECSAFI